MVEKILGEGQAEDIFFSAMITGLLNEKQASDVIGSIEKGADIDWKRLGSGLWDTFKGGASAFLGAIKETPAAVGWTAALGGGLGVLGANLYDSMKKRLTEEDPETKLNNEKELIYSMKERELEDSRWMGRIRRLKDALKRAARDKSVTNRKYRKDFESLLDALKERA